MQRQERHRSYYAKAYCQRRSQKTRSSLKVPLYLSKIYSITLLLKDLEANKESRQHNLANITAKCETLNVLDIMTEIHNGILEKGNVFQD